MAQISQSEMHSTLVSRYTSTVISYSPLTAASHERLTDILNACSAAGASCVCLQGTCRKRYEEHLPVDLISVGGFWVFSCGYGKKSNKHAGVLVALNKKRFPRKSFSIAYPTDDTLAGRAIAVRSRQAQSDVTYLSVYIPHRG